MAGGAGGVDDMDVLRRGAMPEVFSGIRAPSTLGVVPAVVHLGRRAAARCRGPAVPGALAAGTPLLPGAGVLGVSPGMDSIQKRVYGHAKQGAGLGHTKIQGKSLTIHGLNALAAVMSAPHWPAPVITATRLHSGKPNSARGATWLAAEAIQHRPPGPVQPASCFCSGSTAAAPAPPPC